jgi:hypothetical protein
VSRPALGPTQPSVQWAPGVLSPGVKRGLGVTLTTHPHLVPRSRMSRSCRPICLREAPQLDAVGQFNSTLFRGQQVLNEFLLQTCKSTTQYTLPRVTNTPRLNQTHHSVRPCLHHRKIYRSLNEYTIIVVINILLLIFNNKMVNILKVYL